MRVLHKVVFVISARNFWVGIKYVVLLDNLCKFSPQNICCYPSLNDVGTLDDYISTFGHRTPLESFDDKLRTHTHTVSLPLPPCRKWTCTVWGSFCLRCVILHAARRWRDTNCWPVFGGRKSYFRPGSPLRLAGRNRYSSTTPP